MKIPEYPTIDDIMEMAPVLDDDLQALVDAAREDAEGMQQVRNGVHLLARYCTKRHPAGALPGHAAGI